MPQIADVEKNQLSTYQKDKTGLPGSISYVQADTGSVSDEAMDQIPEGPNVSQIDVEGVVPFFHFFFRTPAAIINGVMFTNLNARIVLFG
jgi:NADH:ubiquinone oxidoreductase subunit E